MPRYNVQKRRRLDRLTEKHNRNMRRVIRVDLEKRARDLFEQLNSDVQFLQGDVKNLRSPTDTVFENHEFDVVRSALSDGIQEVTPDNELGLWRFAPEDSCPIITLDQIRPALGKKRDELTEETIKKIRKRRKFSIIGLRNLQLIEYLSILRGGYRSLASDWIEGEGTIRDVLDMLQIVFRKNDNESKKIFRTETTNYFNESRADYFIDETGMDFMQIFALTDGRISDICEDRHEWAFPIAEARQKKKSPSFHPHCYSDDTEVYTNKGWQLFKDVETGQLALSLNPENYDLKWVPIIDKQKYAYKGDMVHLTNSQGSLDLLVTPDHTMFYYKPRTKGLEPVFNSVSTFMQNKTNNWMYVSSKWSGSVIRNKINLCGFKMKPKDFCRFMGFYLSDGSIKFGTKNVDYIQIAQIDGQDIMFKELETFNFKKLTRTKDKIFIYDSRIGAYCKQFGKSPVRLIPEIIKTMTPDLIRQFLDAFNQCDGSLIQSKKFKGGNFKPSKIYFTTSKRMADDLTELLIKVGKSASVKIRRTAGKEHVFRNGTYTINHDVLIVSELNSKHRKARVINKTLYDGFVYDLSLNENHTLLVRRNGSMVWGSNCRTIQRPLTSRLQSHKILINKGLAKNEASFTPLPRGWA